MRLTSLCALVALLSSSPLLVAQTAPPPPDRLPVKRVILYKNGIGYFEHLGKVSGDQSVAIEFTSAQLNDALKSLTALDLGGGRITGISYNSEAPLARRLGALRLPLGEETNLAAFFGALRGARLEAQTRGGSVIGRLLSVEERTEKEGDRSLTKTSIVLVSDNGLVRTIDLDGFNAVRILEADLTRQVGSYLDLVGASREQDARRMTIAATGKGERPLFVSYVSEVPIWKTTYRVVLPSKAEQKPLLQGWAIVDNTVGEDWTDIELSLVAGAPQSFIQQLSQPYFARRPIVPLPEGALLTPQTHDSAMVLPEIPAEVLGEVKGGVYGGVVGGVAGGAPGGVPGAGRGEGTEGGHLARRAPSADLSIEVTAPAPPPRPEMIDAITASVATAATSQELGDLFEYKLKERVTIRKNQSAMVPILNSEVETEKVSLWNAREGSSRPLRALWLTNGSALTLDGGSFTVLEGEAFAGEGLLEPMKPSEKRLISYAADLGVRVDANHGQRAYRVSRMGLLRGVLVQHSEERMRTIYTVRNDDTTARQLILEHPLDSGWKLIGEAKPVETSAGVSRFRVPVGPKATATLVVEAMRVGESRASVTDLGPEQLGLMLKGPSLDEASRQLLRTIAEKQAQIATLDRDLSTRTAEVKRIESDQTRVRENMKALKGSEEEKQLVRRYARQLDEQESRIELLRKEVAEFETRRNAARAELQAIIQQATLDVTLPEPTGDAAAASR